MLTLDYTVHIKYIYIYIYAFVFLYRARLYVFCAQHVPTCYMNNYTCSMRHRVGILYVFLRLVVSCHGKDVLEVAAINDPHDCVISCLGETSMCDPNDHKQAMGA